MAESSISELETTTKPQVLYRCKKCRRIVASKENIVTHERGEGESSFKWKKRSSQPWEMEKQPIDCSSVFVEPMKWMQAVQEGHVEEKLLCIGCNARLGYFNWAGMQCSCGAWVNPAFQLHKSKLDECYMGCNDRIRQQHDSSPTIRRRCGDIVSSAAWQFPDNTQWACCLRTQQALQRFLHVSEEMQQHGIDMLGAVCMQGIASPLW